MPKRRVVGQSPVLGAFSLDIKMAPRQRNLESAKAISHVEAPQSGADAGHHPPRPGFRPATDNHQGRGRPAKKVSTGTQTRLLGLGCQPWGTRQGANTAMAGRGLWFDPGLNSWPDLGLMGPIGAHQGSTGSPLIAPLNNSVTTPSSSSSLSTTPDPTACQTDRVEVKGSPTLVSSVLTS